MVRHRKLLWDSAGFYTPSQASMAHRKLVVRHRKLLWGSASFYTPSQASMARRKLVVRHRKLLWGLRKLLYAVASFYGAPEACGPPPQASMGLRKLLYAAASFYGAPEACGPPLQASMRLRKLLYAAASFYGPPEACGPPPQASMGLRKLLYAAASFCDAPEACGPPPQAGARGAWYSVRRARSPRRGGDRSGGGLRAFPGRAGAETINPAHAPRPGPVLTRWLTKRQAPIGALISAARFPYHRRLILRHHCPFLRLSCLPEIFANKLLGTPWRDCLPCHTDRSWFA